MTVSLICPVYNEIGFIDNCLQSLLEQDYMAGPMEVLVVDGLSNDGSRDVIDTFIKRYPHFRLIDNPKRTAPAAMNLGIAQAVGAVVVRIDAHAVYPPHYVRVLTEKLTSLCAANVGGLINTLPMRNTPTCVAIAKAMSSPFGVGNSYFRIGTKEERRVDTVPFGCFRRDLFDTIGFFDEKLVRGQDNELNGRILAAGGAIYLIPSVWVDYYARDSFGKLARLMYQYGIYKPLVIKKLGHPVTARQFAPPVFVLFLLAGVGCFFINASLFACWAAVLLLYLLLSVCFTLRAHVTFVQGVLLFFAFPLMHLSYGVGYLLGLFKMLFHGKMPQSITR